MYHKPRVLIICFALFLFCACNKVPDHARYIPKDAVAVAGINLKGLSKKIAWNMITGSKLFKEMQSRIPEKSGQDAMGGIEKAGIDYLNTFYVYVKTDSRFNGGNRITGLVPLSDASQWETYVRKVFPNVEIKEHGDRKEASLGKDMYVAWNKNLMIIVNVMSSDNSDMLNGNMGGTPNAAANAPVDISAEMDKAFTVNKDNSILENKHFAGLQEEGHDILFWLNYDQLMTQMNGNMADKMGGISLSNSLWKDAAFTAGFDFQKGKITGDMNYYVPDSLKEIGKDFAADNADKDMLQRLPNQNLDMLMAMHISPKAVKELLVKTDLLGLANIGLGAQGMTVDDVLGALTGDMAVAMNDFSLQTESVTDSFMGQAVVHQDKKPSLNVSYVLKINKKENFQKLVDLAKANGLPQMNNGFALPIDEHDSIYILINDQYAVASNKFGTATGFLQGSFKKQSMPEEAASQIYGHPWSLYLDIAQLFKNIDPAAISNNSAHDSAMLAESKKLLKSISINGGSFEHNAFHYHLDINFTNTDENSIIALMDYGMKMSDADKIKQ